MDKAVPEVENLADFGENLIGYIQLLRRIVYRDEPELFDSLALVVEATARIETRRGTITENERIGIINRLQDACSG
ncbi:hypothetical protein NPJ88_006525 [Halomonas elongata]|uniref:hypothetical protein n=1 Tax=Halomonas elongata TaxID=2746 RepID=UPI00255ADEEC|nr:hypothetical protein [Halomonas elongata]MDL4861981.1 hypothetical protein [Halomonas elongata]